MLGCLLVAALAAPPNVVLVTIDTLRADHLRPYGHPTIATPAADRLAREGLLVEDATAQVPQTRPSHASILTGLHPWEHGIRDNYSPPMGAGIPTLATALKARGYRTGAFLGSYVLASSSGLNRGFDVYDEPFSDAKRGSKLFNRPERIGSEVMDAGLAWMRGAGAGPFFAWLHMYDPHAPYSPPPPFDRKYDEQPYEGEVAYADGQVGRLLDFLDQQKLAPHTLVVVTSDHGEGLGDHGEDEHLLFLYDATLKIPLLFRFPGVLSAGTRVAGQFRSVDLAPTVLALLAAPPLKTSGVSRAAELRKGARLPDNESPSESLFGSLHFGFAPIRALRAEGWKYVDVPRAELYNLREDPGELKNLIELRGTVGARMLERLRTYDKGASEKAKPVAVSPDSGTLERLAALGYVGGAVPLGGKASGADPKDKIQEVQEYRRDTERAREAVSAGDLDGALVLLDRLARTSVVMFDVQHMRGKVLARKKRYAEAVKAFDLALRLVPRFDQIYVDLANAYEAMKQKVEAVKQLDRGLALDPGNVLLLTAKGQLLHRQGDLPGALSVLESARARAPGEGAVRVALAQVYAEQKDEARAEAELRAAVKAGPDDPLGLTALGELLVRQERMAEAAPPLRAALKLKPHSAAALLALARARISEAPEEAVRLLQRLLAFDPGYPGAYDALTVAREQVRKKAGPSPPPS